MVAGACHHPRVQVVAFALGLVAALVAVRALTTPPHRDASAQAALDRAVAAVDRELAADLELMTMFDQTKQAVVLENAAFEAESAVLEREAPAAHAQALALYRRMPDAEYAMERRGPANSLRDEDRAIVEAWEGDARALQRTLREAATARPEALWHRLVRRLAAR